MMKRCWILMLALMLAAMLCACSLGEQITEVTEAPTEAGPRLHTVAPVTTADEDEDENIEWCPVEDCELRFDDEDGNTIMNENDIARFAISPDRSLPMLIFEMTDSAKEMLPTTGLDSFTLSVNGTIVGTAHTTVEGDSVVLTEVPREYDRICEVASMIRGLS